MKTEEDTADIDEREYSKSTVWLVEVRTDHTEGSLHWQQYLTVSRYGTVFFTETIEDQKSGAEQVLRKTRFSIGPGTGRFLCDTTGLQILHTGDDPQDKGRNTWTVTLYHNAVDAVGRAAFACRYGIGIMPECLREYFACRIPVAGLFEFPSNLLLLTKEMEYNTGI